MDRAASAKIAGCAVDPPPLRPPLKGRPASAEVVCFSSDPPQLRDLTVPALAKVVDYVSTPPALFPIHTKTVPIHASIHPLPPPPYRSNRFPS